MKRPDIRGRTAGGVATAVVGILTLAGPAADSATRAAAYLEGMPAGRSCRACLG